MKNLKSKFSSATRAIAVITIIATIVSLLMVALAHDEATMPESAETYELEAVYEPVEIATPAPPDPPPDPPPPAPAPPPPLAAAADGDNIENELFEVRFINYDGRLIRSVMAKSGEQVPFAQAPEREGYIFTGWNFNGTTLMPGFLFTGVHVSNSDVLVQATFSEDPGRSLSDVAGFPEPGHGSSAGEDFGFGLIMPFFNSPGEAAGNDPGGSRFVCQGCSHFDCRCEPSGGSGSGGSGSGGGGSGDSGGGSSGGGWTNPGPFTITFDLRGGTRTGGGRLSQSVAYGGTASYPRTTKEGHTFSHWSRVGGDPTGNNRIVEWVRENRTIRANWSLNRYTVTFDIAGGTRTGGGELSQQVNHGSNAELPTVAKDGHTFTGWAGNYTEVTASTTITAGWEINLYTVQFQNYDGENVLTIENVEWGTGVEAPDSPSKYGHTFSHWDAPFDNVRSDLVITAVHTIDQFDVIFQDHDGKELRRETVIFGTSAAPPEDPTRYGHTFSGWIPDDFTVTKAADLYVAAQYTLTPFYVIFLNHDDSEHARQSVLFGESGRRPVDPVKYGHTFQRWSTDDFTVRAERNVVINPIFALNVYNVTFFNHDGSVISAQSVSHGSAATEPDVPGRGGFTFTGWDSDYSYVSSNLAVTAMFRQLAVGEIPTCRQPDCDETEGLCDRCDRCEEHCICCSVDGCNNLKACDDCGRCADHCDCTSWVLLGRPDGTETIIREIDIPEAALMGLDGYSTTPITPQGTPPLFTFMGRNVYLWAPFGISSWALVNLVLAILGIVLFVAKTIPAIIDKKEKEQPEGNEDNNVDFLKGKNKFLLVSGVLSLVAIILFFITQDLTALTALFDIWTIVHTAIFITTIIALKLFKGHDDTGDMGDETEITSIYKQEMNITDDKTIMLTQNTETS